MIITHRCKEFKRRWAYTSVDAEVIVLTDAKAEFVVLDPADVTIVLIRYTLADYLSLDAANGMFTLTVPGNAFILAAGEYQYFMRVLLANGTFVLFEKSIMQVLFLPENSLVSDAGGEDPGEDPYVDPYAYSE